MNRKLLVFVFFFALSLGGAIALTVAWQNPEILPSVTTRGTSSVTKLLQPSEVPVKEQRPIKKSAPMPSLKARYCENPHGTTCTSGWPSVDPTGQVSPDVTGEVLALRHLRKIIRAHPTWQSEQIDSELARRIYTSERTDLIREVFDFVIDEMSDLLLELSPDVFSQGERNALLEQLLKIKLEMPPPAETYSDSADLLTKNAVYYERTYEGELRLRVGGAYLLNASSWYNLVFTFAHEIAHAIDPCEAENAGIVPRIYSPLKACFMRMGWVRKDLGHCGRGEQVSEVFADWMATRLTAKSLLTQSNNYSSDDKVKSAINFGRDLCEQSSSPDVLSTLFHQAPQIRVGSIIGQSPLVREAVGCEKRVLRRYCDFEEVK